MINSSLCLALEVGFFCLFVCVVMQREEAKLLQIRKLLCGRTNCILVVMPCSHIDMSVFDAILCLSERDQ